MNTGMEWQQPAERLAVAVTRPDSRWRRPVAVVPRHLLIPRWFEARAGTWEVRDGHGDERAWLEAAYSPVRSLVTRVGPVHADHAAGEPVKGRPTSSATLPLLVVMMLQYTCIQDDSEVVEIGTGSGYGTALLARRLGDSQVTSVELDAYLTQAARERLDAMGLRPRLVTADATGALGTGVYDRLVATTSVWRIPVSWLTALRPGGWLVTTISGTGMIITAGKTPDGGAAGQVEWMSAGFMPIRSDSDYPPALQRDDQPFPEGESSRGRYPLANLPATRNLRTMLQLAAPGIEHDYRRTVDGLRTATMLHPDGSWAVATAEGLEPPLVRQGGPRRLWDMLDDIRSRWLAEGCEFPFHGATATISPDGTCELTKGNWSATIA
jgi:protein-L-isoaspartate O-methyltransferase